MTSTEFVIYMFGDCLSRMIDQVWMDWNNSSNTSLKFLPKMINDACEHLMFFFWGLEKEVYSHPSYNAMSVFRIVWKPHYKKLIFNHTNQANS